MDPFAHDRVLDQALHDLRPADPVGPREVADYLNRLSADIPTAGEYVHDYLSDLLDGELADIARLAAMGDDAAIGGIVGATIRSEAMKALRGRLRERPSGAPADDLRPADYAERARAVNAGNVRVG